VHPAAPARVLQPGVIQMAEWKHHGEDQGEESAGEWGQVCGGTAPGCCRSVEDYCALAGASSDRAAVEKVTAGDWEARAPGHRALVLRGRPSVRRTRGCPGRCDEQQLGLPQRPQRGVPAPPAAAAGEPVELPHRVREAWCHEFPGQRSGWWQRGLWWQGRCDLRGRASREDYLGRMI
jgi:hypothetical protein